MRRAARRAAALCSLAALLGVVPAHADPAFDPRWTTNHVLRNYFSPASGAQASSTVARGDIVSLWQQILVYDLGVAEAPCQDGVFGPLTAAATREWQQTMSAYATDAVVRRLGGATGFYVDGVVGPQTWTLASHFLVFTDADSESTTTHHLNHVYLGRRFQNFRLALYAFTDEHGDVVPLEWLFDDYGDGLPYLYRTDHPGVTTANC